MLLGSLAILVWVTLVWLMSLRMRDASIVDRIWGMNFVLLSFVYASQAPTLSLRGMFALALVTIWGVRLSLHIHIRNRGHSEDWRYQNMRAKGGPAYWLKSYFSVFLLQGALSIIISLPLALCISSEPGPLSTFDYLGITLWVRNPNNALSPTIRFGQLSRFGILSSV